MYCCVGEKIGDIPTKTFRQNPCKQLSKFEKIEEKN